MRKLLTLSKWTLWILSAVVLVVCVWQLESERSTVVEQQIETQVGRVSIYSDPIVSNGPLVVVTHGFAGSRQMMQYISRDLARAGFTVAAFDFYGHGRNPEKLSPDVTRIEGTTQQLIEQTQLATKAVKEHLGQTGPMALLGHSMATDVVVRAARDMPDVAAIVAISMYSDAVTASFPERLLILSGEWEGRLRDFGLRVLAQVDEAATEGETAKNGAVLRRAVSVPRTEHVAVLFSPATMQETRNWLQAALTIERETPPQPRGVQIALLLTAISVLIWPLSHLLPMNTVRSEQVRLSTFLLAITLPVVPAIAVAIATRGVLFGFAAFGSLTLFFSVWGGVALAILWRAGVRPQRPRYFAGLFLILWALGGFAMALDRYGAAFVPVGPRAGVMLALLVGTVPFALSDRLLVRGASLWRRIAARVVPVVALAGAMALSPQSMGLSFSVLPVMILFYGVYGTMARAIARRAGPEAAGLALGIVLAWSIAASTPLFGI